MTFALSSEYRRTGPEDGVHPENSPRPAFSTRLPQLAIHSTNRENTKVFLHCTNKHSTQYKCRKGIRRPLACMEKIGARPCSSMGKERKKG